MMEKVFLSVDLQILQFFYSLRSPFLDKTFIFITNLGGNGMMVFGILVVLFLTFKKRWKLVCLFIFVTGGSVVMDTVLKNYFLRIRPQFYPLINMSDYSFPSGHAMNSLVFYVALSYMFFTISKNRRLFLIMRATSIFLSLLIGISRIYLGVHYPSDVLGGYMVGTVWLTIIFSMTHQYKTK